jgi:hypothetical protein
MAWSVVGTAKIAAAAFPNVDQTNFPGIIYGTFPHLRTVANGGYVTSASGYDIGFYSDAARTTLYKFDLIAYNPVTGSICAVVKLTGTTATGALAYIGAGDAAITTNVLQDRANTYVGTYKRFSFDGLTDRTSNANDLTNGGGTADTTDPVDALGEAFSGSPNNASRAQVKTGYTGTMLVAFKPSSLAATTTLAMQGDTVANGWNENLRLNSTGACSFIHKGVTVTSPTTPFTVGAWGVAAARTISQTSRFVYANADAGSSSASSSTNAGNPNVYGIAAFISTGGAESAYFQGVIGLDVVADTDLGADWITAMTRLILNQSTYVTVNLAPASVVTALQTLVSDLGGDAALPHWTDMRAIPTGAVGTLRDTIGPVSGRAEGFVLTQATGAQQPVIAGGRLTFAAANSQHIISAADTRLPLDAATPIHLIVVSKATAAGKAAYIAKDPTDATQYPFVGIQTVGSNWKGDVAPTGSGDRFQPDSGVAFAGGALRLHIIGHSTRGAQSGNGDYNDVWRYVIGGRQYQRADNATTATNVPAGNKLVLGRHGTTYFDGEIAAVGVLVGDITNAKLKTLIAFVQAQYGATMVSDKVGNLVFTGSSLPVGFSGTDAKTLVPTSGTTSPPWVCSRTNSGSRGDFVAQGFDVGDIHSFNYATNGFDYVGINAIFDTDLALIPDGTRAGPFVVVSFEIGNTALNLGKTSGQILTEIAALTTKIHLLGGKHYVVTCPDRGPFYTGGVINAVGIAARDTNIELRANTALYCDGIIELELSAGDHFKIERAGTLAYLDGTYYSGSTHQTDPGQALEGTTIKTFFDTNDTILWPGAGDAFMRRLGLGIGIGL